MCQTATLISCGQTVSRTTTNVSEIDVYDYSGTAGQVLEVAFWAITSSTMEADIYNPGGQLVKSLNGGAGVDGAGGSSLNLMLTTNGTFKILVYDVGNAHTNSYSLTVQSVVNGGCDTPGAFVCGQPPTTNTTVHYTEMDAYSLTGDAGQILEFAFWAVTTGQMQADIYNPSGQLLTSFLAGASVGSAGGASLNLALTNTGTFTILVHASDYALTNTYALSVQSVMNGGCDTLGAIVCGQPPTTNATTHYTEMDTYSLTGNAGQILEFAFWAVTTGQMQADIYNPSGQLLTSFLAGASVGSAGGASLNLALTNTGTFTVLVHASDYALTNTYAFSVQSRTGGGCDSTSIMCGQTINSNLDSPAQILAYGFGTGGGLTFFSFNAAGTGYDSGARFDLYDPTGNKIFTGTPGASPSTNLAAGTYTLLVHDGSFAGVGTYMFTVNCVVPCNYLISTNALSVGAPATSGTVTVNAGSGCAWTNTSSASWLNVSPTNGSGDAILSYMVDANCEPSNRLGTMTIAGFTFYVNQSNPVPFEEGTDIGTPGTPGSFTYTNCGTYIVNGSGEGTDGSADVFYFLSSPLTGDAQIIARLQSLQGGDARLAEAGVMMRETLDPGAKQVSFSMNAGTNAIFRRRLGADATSIQTSFRSTNYLQGTNYIWLRLMRMGNTFVAHYSTNGLTWQYMWFTTLSMSNQVQVGLAVTAHGYAQLATAMFDNVSIGALTPLSGAWPLPGPELFIGGQGWSEPEFQRVGGFEFLLEGNVGDYFGISGSTNVAVPFASWSPVATVTNTYGVVPVFDTNAVSNNVRFYRAKRLGP
jgi:hypothetical protein